jgi:hypothetical protein
VSQLARINSKNKKKKFLKCLSAQTNIAQTSEVTELHGKYIIPAFSQDLYIQAVAITKCWFPFDHIHAKKKI